MNDHPAASIEVAMRIPGHKPIDNAHALADMDGPHFQAFAQESPQDLAGSPMHNPIGRLKLVSMKDVGETN